MSVYHVSGVSLQQCDRCPSIWLGASEREALWRTRSAKPMQEFAQFVPGKNPPAVRCPSCETGRLQSGLLGQCEAMGCTRCKGVFVSFKRKDGSEEELATWRKVVLDILYLLH
ncbi:MAG: hypothetical protein LAO05_06345 [Acidobacteriia bacterium]|nr:hypothetical protein [Terriglobia bacterium]